METAKNYLQQPYTRVVIPVESRGYHAEILEFPGCFAQGETVEKAYNNLERAAESWIESALSQGHAIPQPSANLTYSGRIALRLPVSIHQQAAHLAERNDTSLNTFIVSAVSAKVGAEELYNTLAERFAQEFPVTHAYNLTLVQQNLLVQQQQTSTMFQRGRIRPKESHSTSTNAPKLLLAGGR